MARITIEDCLEQVPNRFDIIQMATKRAKQLNRGSKPISQSDDNKVVVTSLREIAAGHIRAKFADDAEDENAQEEASE